MIRSAAIAQGLAFLDLALVQTDAAEGYFIEKGGYDSSYNGVALKLAIELLSIMDYESVALEAAVLRAARWQVGRILESGEVSTEGNTRVYPGGEDFLGMEKQLDVVKTVKALYYLSVIADDPALRTLGNRVANFYN